MGAVLRGLCFVFSYIDFLHLGLHEINEEEDKNMLDQAEGPPSLVL